MQDDLSLIKLLLNLHDAICLGGVLVFNNILLQLREVKGTAYFLANKGCPGVLDEELIDNLGKKLMGDESRVVCVRNDDARYAFGPAVDVECV